MLLLIRGKEKDLAVRFFAAAAAGTNLRLLPSFALHFSSVQFSSVLFFASLQWANCADVGAAAAAI